MRASYSHGRFDACSLCTQQFGMQLRLFDDIDERALTPGQVKTFCELLLGCPPLPEPDVDRHAFLDAIDMELAAQPQVFDPISKKMTPWIKTQFLEPGLPRDRSEQRKCPRLEARDLATRKLRRRESSQRASKVCASHGVPLVLTLQFRVLTLQLPYALSCCHTADAATAAHVQAHRGFTPHTAVAHGTPTS